MLRRILGAKTDVKEKEILYCSDGKIIQQPSKFNYVYRDKLDKKVTTDWACKNKWYNANGYVEQYYYSKTDELYCFSGLINIPGM